MHEEKTEDMKYLRHDIAQTWLAIALSLVVYICSYSHASAQQLTQSGLDAGRFVTTIDGKQTPAFEIMHSNAAIRNLIREEKTYQIDSVIASHGAEGMRTMDQSLFALCKGGRITSDTALRFSVHEEALERRLQAEGLL